MRETPDDVAALQGLLNASRRSATDHLRDIIGDERALTAADLVAPLTVMKVLALATVTAKGKPRISAVDGHFLHATWTFSTGSGAARARHMRDRPSVSVAHIDNVAARGASAG